MREPFVLHLGDCREVMASLPDESVDAVVTDPPYELGFMGKAWDAAGVAYDVAVWSQALRVLKPGGHLLAFGGSRTYHRLACAIEDAGFEIRDQIMWVYGSGFPKSLDVSKAIDKAAGAEREVVGEREVWGRGVDRFADIGEDVAVEGNAKVAVTAPATDSAREWDGWGTALKPAHEPIVVARKPLIGTVAENVLRYGTGALNIDGCRVGSDGGTFKASKPSGRSNGIYGEGINGRVEIGMTGSGRWPANFIHDGDQTVLDLFPAQAGSNSTVYGRTAAPEGAFGWKHYKSSRGEVAYDTRKTGGSAARFFYCAKASKRDRDEGLEGFEERVAAIQMPSNASKYERRDGQPGANLPRRNHHPTVKPTDLMRYLVRLVTPPGGVVLDPFTGSGSTGKAAMLEGFEFIGIEQDAEYLAIARARIGAVGREPHARPEVDLAQERS